MAEKEGRVTMTGSGNKLKSLVSYGMSYDDDDDDDVRDEKSRTQNRSSSSHVAFTMKQTKPLQSIALGKRPHSNQREAPDFACGDEQPQHKKKSSLPFTSYGPAPAYGPAPERPNSAKSGCGSAAGSGSGMFSMKLASSKPSSSNPLLEGLSGPKSNPIKMNLSGQNKVKDSAPSGTSSSSSKVKTSLAVAQAFGDDDSDEGNPNCCRPKFVRKKPPGFL